MSRGIRDWGYWEITEPQMLGDLADVQIPQYKHGSRRPVMLDIGANLGVYSLLFAHFGYRVLAIEPMLHNRLAFECTLSKIHHSVRQRITLLPYAIGAAADLAETGGVCIVSPSARRLPSNGRLTCGKAAANALLTGHCRNETELKHDSVPVCQRVSMATLDNVLREQAYLRAIDVVKIDVDIWHTHTIGVQKTLKKQIVLNGVYVCDL